MLQWWRRRSGARADDAGPTAPGEPDRRRDQPPRRGLPAPGTPEERRFAQVYADDRVGPMPYPNQASPDVAAARGRVRALVADLLPGAVDEGTGAALDPLIASWASGWLARIDSEHADHHAVIDRLVGGARRQLADAEAAHERDRRALEVARRDYTDARERLMEPSGPAPAPAPAPATARPVSRPTTAPTVPAGPAPGSRPEPPREDLDGPEPRAGAEPDPAPRRSRLWGEETGSGRRSAARGPRAARQALAVRGTDGSDTPPPPDPATGPMRVTPSSYGTTLPEGAPPGSARHAGADGGRDAAGAGGNHRSRGETS